MEHTEYYQLSQWEADDRIQMEDFNADNAKIDAALAASLKIATGSYTGTGTYGINNKTSLHFDFAPKLLLVAHSGENSSWFLWMQGCLESKWGGTGMREHVEISGTTVSWYSEMNTPSAENQMNGSGAKYRYVAIG